MRDIGLECVIMNNNNLGNDVVTLPVSRPKIHRLPASLSSPEPRYSLRSFRIARGVRMLGLLVVVSVALFIGSRLSGPSSIGGDATVTVAAARLSPASGDAMASIPDIQTLNPDGTSKTIHIEGKSEAIVGQLARIPSENSNLSDIKTVSEVDNRAGRELLSIISKY